jgi:hypothetical protein
MMFLARETMVEASRTLQRRTEAVTEADDGFFYIYK